MEITERVFIEEAKEWETFMGDPGGDISNPKSFSKV
jgi:hypothetical protein